MQAIVIGLGSAGDVHPNVGLALALQRRGFDVRFVATAVFRSLADSVGLAFTGLGTEEEYLDALRDPDLWHPVRSFSLVARKLILPSLRPVYQLIEEHCRRGPTVVAAPGFAFGARLAQEKLGVPLATVHLQPVILRSVVQPACFGFPDLLNLMPRALRPLYYRFADKWMIDRELLPELNSFRAELRLPPVRRVFDRWFHSPQRIIGLFPEWYAPPLPDWPANVSLTGFPLWDATQVNSVSPEVEEFLAAGDPPVVITAGSAMLHARSFFQVSIDGLQSSRRRALLLTQFPEQLPENLPPGVRHFRYVPFSAVLPRCAALIHHGGIGSAAQAIAAGIPQLIVPFAHDQPDNAVRIRRLQLGDFVLPRDYTRVRAAQALERVLLPEVHENCRRAAARVNRDSLDVAAALVAELAKERVAGATLR